MCCSFSDSSCIVSQSWASSSLLVAGPNDIRIVLAAIEGENPIEMSSVSLFSLVLFEHADPLEMQYPRSYMTLVKISEGIVWMDIAAI